MARLTDVVGELFEVLAVAMLGDHHLRPFCHGRRWQIFHLPLVAAAQHGGSGHSAGRGQRSDVEQQQPAEPICARADKEKQSKKIEKRDETK